ncbi:hypothetical protein BDV3_004172 [Batrachochytrium dendrobatidis]
MSMNRFDFVAAAEKLAMITNGLWTVVVDDFKMPSLLPFLQRSFTIHSDKIIHSKPSSILTTVDFESHLDDHQDPACCHSIDASSTAVNQSTIECKFDIVYSLPWGCPVLYFSIVDDTGMPLSLSEIMLVFNIQSPILDNNDSHRFWNTAISMQDHPVYSYPCWTIHPCNIHKAISEQIHSDATPLQYLLLWISINNRLLNSINLIDIETVVQEK